MMTIESTMPRLTSILAEAAFPRDPLLYKTGFWGRGQVRICFKYNLTIINH